MLRVRRLWLLPAFLLTCLIYLLFFRSEQSYTPFIYPSVVNDGLLHWKKLKERFPVRTWITIPRGQPLPATRIQFPFELHAEVFEDKKVRESRRDIVKESFVHAWTGYKQRAWAKDEVGPISGTARSSFGGWGATMVDAMDSLWIMGLEEDFDLCVEAVRNIDFTTNTEDVVNVFETTIRYLGGLMAAYDLTNRRDKVIINKAKELAEILFTAFDTPNRMPATRWQWRKSALGEQVEASESTLLAELGSLTVEFTRLTQVTGDPKFYDAAARILNALHVTQFNSTMPGLWPTIINAKDLTVPYNQFTFGGMADSTYEYLPKQFMLLGVRNPQTRQLYQNAMAVAKRHMFFRPLTRDNKDVLFTGNVRLIDGVPVLEPQGQHLGCFVGGMMGIASKLFNKPEELEIARRVVDGCIMAYDAMPSGLMPETFHMVPCHKGVGPAEPGECEWSDEKWYEGVAARHGTDIDSQNLTPVEAGKHWVETKGLIDGFTDIADPRYILRPEAIESIFILYRITGDTRLQDHAWRMFQAIEKAARTDLAHAQVVDVRVARPELADRMESFWLAETLKYFYLIFSEPTLISLDDFVFNTEAHPFSRPKRPGKQTYDSP